MNRDRTLADAPAPACPSGPQPPLRASRPPCTALAVDFLRFSLRTGERSRRELMLAAARLGLTPKMIRVARERLGAVAERRGFGPKGGGNEPAPCR
jgi:hypothetical protein